MPVLQLDDKQFPLKGGVTRIGAGTDADVVVPGNPGTPVEAIIDGGSTPTIRRATEQSQVRVNGVLLGAEPTPLMHGDKVEVAGLELHYADDAKGGVTEFISASELEALTGVKRSGASRATTASGGRIVSLMDGKEYLVSEDGLVFGRDAGCDVVVPKAEVSRRHAEILPAESGYIVRDISANGLFVNGERVQGQRLLARADVLRIGNEEFRFYADVASATPRPAVTHAPITPAVAARLATPPRAVPVAALITPSATRDDARPALAMLEILNEGPANGTRYEIRSPLTRVGRGVYNDVELHHESVSDSHATLQWRDDGWYVVDMESTNGTYVGGSRISSERRIEGLSDVRFGELRFRFTAIGGFDSDAKGTRAIAAMRPPAMGSPRAVKTPDSPPTAKPPTTSPSSMPTAEPEMTGGSSAMVWVVIGLAVVAAVAFFLLKR